MCMQKSTTTSEEQGVVYNHEEGAMNCDKSWSKQKKKA
jgi:hypothetical protein